MINVAVLPLDKDHVIPKTLLTKIEAMTGISVILVNHEPYDIPLLDRTKCPSVAILYASEELKLETIDHIKQIKEHYPRVGFILVAKDLSIHVVRLAYQSGILTCLPLNVVMAEISIAILAANRGEYYLSPIWGQRFVNAYVEYAQPMTVQQLSRRQQEIFKLLANGQSVAEVADRLAISTKTVETHRHRIMKRLEINNLVSLTHIAYREKLLSVFNES
jgi:DNA-binding NarL/FixJ family response regulator